MIPLPRFRSGLDVGTLKIPPMETGHQRHQRRCDVEPGGDLRRVDDRRRAAEDRDRAAVDEDVAGGVAADVDRVVETIAERAQDADAAVEA